VLPSATDASRLGRDDDVADEDEFDRGRDDWTLDHRHDLDQLGIVPTRRSKPTQRPAIAGGPTRRYVDDVA
jgi:hypothetical protein